MDLPPPPPDAPSPDLIRTPGRLSEGLIMLAAASTPGGLRIRQLFESLSGRGHAAVLVVLSFPFCLPVPLPGLSVIFGIVLVFVGFRIAFGHRPWLPRWILEKPVQHQTLLALARRLAAFEKRTHKMLRPRLVFLCRDPGMHRLSGLLVAVLGTLLALPLPIPFSNIPAAFPMLLLGLGLLEDDGRFIIFAYAAAFFAFGIFAALFWFGGVGLEHIIEAWHTHWR